MEYTTDLLEILNNINPSLLDYQEWCNVGMALKYEGYTASDWDYWSQRDSKRYHKNECYRKWDSFTGSGVTGGTIVQYARNQGWVPPMINQESGHELDWDDVIEKDEQVIIDKNWIEGREVREPTNWNPVNELITYLEILFDSTENVGYVTKTWLKDKKHLPTQGCWDRTAGKLIQQLNKCDGDIGAVLGDYNKEAGAWIRFNPLDGKGCKNSNVTDFKYALVESDSMPIAEQNAVLRELELPIACLVHSGGKSLHAIVRIEANDMREYRKRVDYLNICKKNGLDVDTQNRNPSRLSRMPGVIRNGKKQFLVDTNIGKESWDEWYEWIESINDDLPEPESLVECWNNLPQLAPPLIEGILRQGHKMLVAGPSKAGKSFTLIELCIAIAEGKKWLNWQCAQGKTLYVNLELDRPSCLHRFKDVYNALGIKPNNLTNIDIWNLRGKSIPMDKLAPKLIRRASKKDYIAVVIDPIYKVITGDENSADQMANFCNQFDKICNELGTSVIYCHHHSKGSQGGKRSMDRASGSGVFARDPDALLDLIELDLNETHYKQLRNMSACKCCVDYLRANRPELLNELSQDDVLSQSIMIDFCKSKFGHDYYKELDMLVNEARDKATSITAWRIEGTLREFSKFPPVNLYFEYPVHVVDQDGVLQDIDPDDVKPQWQKAKEKRQEQAEKNKNKKANQFEIEFSNIEIEGREVPAEELAEKLNTAPKTLLGWLGKGKKRNEDLAENFEAFYGENGKRYIKRKDD